MRVLKESGCRRTSAYFQNPTLIPNFEQLIVLNQVFVRWNLQRFNAFHSFIHTFPLFIQAEVQVTQPKDAIKTSRDVIWRGNITIFAQQINGPTLCARCIGSGKLFGEREASAYFLEIGCSLFRFSVMCWRSLFSNKILSEDKNYPCSPVKWAFTKRKDVPNIVKQTPRPPFVLIPVGPFLVEMEASSLTTS